MAINDIVAGSTNGTDAANIINQIKNLAESSETALDNLATVATTGSYNDLTNTPAAATEISQSDIENNASTTTGLITGQRAAQAVAAHESVKSVNSATGDVVLNTDDVAEGTNQYFTAARAKSAAVADTIADSVTDVAPSQNAVYDALALKQPLDADLTSWASVTRAAGFDTFVSTPSSANLAALVTNETGSGALVFGTAPTINNVNLTGTVTVPNGALAIADTNGLQTALDGKVGSATITTIWSGTQAADDLLTPDANTFYIITEP